jgi:amino acid transporter
MALSYDSFGRYSPLASNEASRSESPLRTRPSTDSDTQHFSPTSQRSTRPQHLNIRGLPDEQEGPVEDSQIPSKDQRALTFLNGLAIVIGLQIGSGIFSAPSQVSNHVPSPGAGVLVWLVGGLLVWTGAASFIELGLAIPRNGGVQEYLQACYGDFMGFLFTWNWVVIAKPSAVAMIAMVFSDHLCRAIPSAQLPSVLVAKAVALLSIASITFLNCCGAKTGARVAIGFLVLKLFAVSSIIILGIVTMARGAGAGIGPGKPGWFSERPGIGHQNVWHQIGEYVTALYGALFCYSGWETVSITFPASSARVANRENYFRSVLSRVI